MSEIFLFEILEVIFSEDVIVFVVHDFAHLGERQLGEYSGVLQATS